MIMWALSAVHSVHEICQSSRHVWRLADVYHAILEWITYMYLNRTSTKEISSGYIPYELFFFHIAYWNCFMKHPFLMCNIEQAFLTDIFLIEIQQKGEQ